MRREKKSNSSKIKSTIKNSDKVVNVGRNEKYEILPKLTFEKVSEQEFSSVEVEPNSYFMPFLPEFKKNYFYINTNDKKQQFKKYDDYGKNGGWNGCEPLKYYSKLKLFALNEYTFSDDLEFGELFLLDSLTNYRYNIESIGDGSVELPSVSPNNKYLAYYYNDVYSKNKCDIRILKINDKSNPRSYLTEYQSFNSRDFKIKRLIWKSDNCFYIEGYEEVYKNNTLAEKYKYYKTVFK